MKLSSLCLILTLLLGLFNQVWTMKKNPVMTIQSPDGDFIDCIHMSEQPAFDHPVLQDHIIQDAPRGRLPKMMENIEGKRVWQVWNQNGSSCPEETVPIRRTMNGAKHFRKLKDVGVNHRTVPYAAEKGHEHATGMMTQIRGIYGTVATMNVWKPVVERGTNEFSLSQIWLVKGHYNDSDSDLNTIEAGWMVNPDHYLDNQPRLFVYWTRDTYQKTGCLNLECPGFVQVSKQYAIGTAFSPTSSYNGTQFDITMFIWKDTKDGNWWLGIGSTFIGYWPVKLFTHLAKGPASLVQWGGEVVNRRSYGQHTTTQMGSGHFPEEGYGKAKHPTCYNATKGYNVEWGAHFYYGGPGYNALCP